MSGKRDVDAREHENTCHSELKATVHTATGNSRGDSVKTQHTHTTKSFGKSVKQSKRAPHQKYPPGQTSSQVVNKKARKPKKPEKAKKPQKTPKPKNSQKENRKASLLKWARASPGHDHPKLVKSVANHTHFRAEPSRQARSRDASAEAAPKDTQLHFWASPRPASKEHTENTNFLIVQKMRRLKKHPHRHRPKPAESKAKVNAKVKASRRKLMFPTESTKSLTRMLDVNRFRTKAGGASDVPKLSTTRTRPQLRIETDQLIGLEHIVSPINQLNPNRLDFSVDESIALASSSARKTKAGQNLAWASRTLAAPRTGRRSLAKSPVEPEAVTRRITFPKKMNRSEVNYLEYFGSNRL